MTSLRTLIAISLLTGLTQLAVAQEAKAPRVAPAEAKDHIGQLATVCGKVVDTGVAGNGLLGHGRPVSFYLDQPQQNPVFYFVLFSTGSGGPDDVVKAKELIKAYDGKNVCIAGKIQALPAGGGGPFIMVADRSHVKVQTNAK